MELQFIKWIQTFHTEWLDQFFIAITMLGEEFFYISVLSLTYWCLNKKDSRYLVFILGVSIVLNGALKELFNHPRPIGVEGIRSFYTDTAEGHAFPSGHTQTATAFFAGIMTLFKNKIIGVFSIFAILLVGLSRVYLGVHWPTDVIGGIFFGVLAVLLGRIIYRKSDVKNVYWPYFLILILTVGSLMFFTSAIYVKAVGVLTGIISGYFIEENYIGFDVRAPIVNQMMKYLLGLAMTGGVFLGLEAILPQGIYWDGFRYYLTVVFVMAGAPSLFMTFKWSRRRIF